MSNRIARELVFLAKELVGIEFPTQDAMDKYLKEHPDADRSNHRVVETKRETPKKEDVPGVPPRHAQGYKKLVEGYERRDKQSDDDLFELAVDYAADEMGLDVEEAHAAAYKLMESIGRKYKGA